MSATKPDAGDREGDGLAVVEVGALLRRCHGILTRAGAASEVAQAVADVLVDGELMGHGTHGLLLLEPYVDELLCGRMSGQGEWRVVKRSVAAELWDGCRLPGPWLVRHALARAQELAGTGVGVVSVGRSHHVACLAAYLRVPAEQGYLALLTSSDPAVAAVAPPGGRGAVISPNPIAAGIPGPDRPVIVDVSTSITTLGLCRKVAAEGAELPGEWLQDAAGTPTRDPAVLSATPPGALLPLGGTQSGHKGFGLGLLVEALTGALSGQGRAKSPDGWGANVTAMVVNPAAFAGLEAFKGEIALLAARSQAVPPTDPTRPVRLPGMLGLARREAAMRDGAPVPRTMLATLDRLERTLPPLAAHP